MHSLGNMDIRQVLTSSSNRHPKRKSAEIIDPSSLQSNGSTVTVYTDSGSTRYNSSGGDQGGKDLDDCRTLIQTMLDEFDEDKDDVNIFPELQELAMLPQIIESEHDEYVEREYNSIKMGLNQQIEHEHERRRENAAEVEKVNQQIQQLIRENKEAQEELDMLTKQEQQLEDEIALLLSQVTKNMDDMEKYREICKQKVPKLRQQLSLYANITRIRWNFENEHMLCGQYNVPLRHEIKHFELDPAEMSRFDIAQELWKFIGESIEAKE